jgi:hypothetical protein
VLHGTMNGPKVWTDVNMRFMPPNVNVRPADARKLVSWILSLDTSSLPPRAPVPAHHP